MTRSNAAVSLRSSKPSHCNRSGLSSTGRIDTSDTTMPLLSGESTIINSR